MEAPRWAHIFLTVHRAHGKTVFRASVLRKRTLSGRYGEFDPIAELGQVSGRTSLRRSADGQRTATCEAADINPLEVSYGGESCDRHEGGLRQSEGRPGSVRDGARRARPGIEQR